MYLYPSERDDSYRNPDPVRSGMPASALHWHSVQELGGPWGTVFHERNRRMNALAIPVQLYTPFFALLAACHQTAAEVTSFCAQSAQEQPPGQWAAQVHALRAHVHVLRSTVAAQLDKVDALLAFCEE